MIYDTIIIGSGPAGVAAAIYAARREMKTIILTKDLGGQLALASTIENYPGFESIDSFELTQKMHNHVKSLGVEIRINEVKKIEKQDDKTFKLFTEKEELTARTIILTMGLAPRRLAIPGEEQYSGKGVSYCSTCDGPFYKKKIVAVVGGGNSALDAAEVLSKIAEKVYLIHRQNEFRGFEALIKKVNETQNIEIILNSQVKEITGNILVEKIKVTNNDSNEERTIDINGIFIEAGRVAHTDLVADLCDRNEKKEILVNEKCNTKTPGLFAAGDVTQVPFKQISIATGQATIAALAAYQYLQLKEGKTPGILLDRSPVRKQVV